MTLIVNNPVQGPGLHALIIGISDYSKLPEGPGNSQIGLGLTKLASPALSAFRLYEWLVNPPGGTSLAVPLKTVRLLLAPSATEIAAEQKLGAVRGLDNNPIERPTRRTVQLAAMAWRDDATSLRKDLTLFYFTGHGIRTTGEEAVMLFDDFGDESFPKFANCAEVGRLRQAMAPSRSRPEIARTQFYFVDCCRNLPEQVKDLDNPQIADLFDVDLNIDETGRATPTYFATPNGSTALSRDGDTTVFCEALLHALEHGASSPEDADAGQPERWPVTDTSLKTGIKRYLQRRYHGKAPEVWQGGTTANPTLHYLAAAPSVEFDLEVVPDTLAGKARVAFIDVNAARDDASSLPLETTKLTPEIPAGVYRMKVVFDHKPGEPPPKPAVSKAKPVTQDLDTPWRFDTRTAGV
jgi:Caspase domain